LRILPLKFLALFAAVATQAATVLPPDVEAAWQEPAIEFRPRTRWWWPGNALTESEIERQLREMHAQGIGGVEIMSCWRVYSRGNASYLSPQWADRVRHAVRTARELDMKVALTFGPGWSFGGSWVPPEDRSKALVRTAVDVSGGATFDGPLPAYVPAEKPTDFNRVEPWLPTSAPDELRVLAVVAGRVTEDGLDGDSLTDLTEQVRDGRLRWSAPPGTWRLMVFRLKYTGQRCHAQTDPEDHWVVDHFNPDAMRRHVEHLGGVLEREFGEEFGRTIDSLFSDSFEMKPLEDSLLWSGDTLERFFARKGYDLKRYLPALWENVGPLTPRVRFDVNELFHELGRESFYAVFTGWCEAHRLEARIQPHDAFPTELIEAAGLSPRPETEKSSTAFEVMAFPRKSEAAGARFYGRAVLSAEAFTVLHRARYRTTLAELKRATDSFLRDGVTQFYNHGWFGTPEREPVPTRDAPWATRINPWATWWPYYHFLSDYTARCSALLRAGRFAGDVLVYSPYERTWAERGIWGGDWRKVPYGDLGRLLVANGYDFDPVNADVLLNRATIDLGAIGIAGNDYRVLLLPGVSCTDPAVLRFALRFVENGGTVIALNELPSAATGMVDAARRDAELRGLVETLFGGDGRGRDWPNGGRTRQVTGIPLEEPEFPIDAPPDWYRIPPLAGGAVELVGLLREVVEPDFSFVDRRQSDGLTFLHRVFPEAHVYFVTNLSETDVDESVRFRLPADFQRCEVWDPRDGSRRPGGVVVASGAASEVNVRLAAGESAFFVFQRGESRPVPSRGAVRVTVTVGGPWRLQLGSIAPPRSLRKLASWTDDPGSRHFSGTGIYECEFDIDAGVLRTCARAELDLGRVGEIAEVELNGRAAGVTWMPPHRLDVTTLVQPGRNALVVRVTNLLISQIAGLSSIAPMPRDLVADYGEALEPMPGQLRGDPEPAYARDWRILVPVLEAKERNYSPLPESGLLGPVRIAFLGSDPSH
jgi:hypothetical protein